MQRPAVQFWPMAHARPHAPQFSRSVRMSTSQPFVAIPSQLPKPALQVKPQAPAVQVAAAFARAGQTFPHLPQWIGLVAKFASQPLAALPSQLP
jgi:hypothetical protein